MQYLTKIANREDAMNVETPVGELEWVQIEGEGKLNTLNNEREYTATLVIPGDSEAAKAFNKELDEFWKSAKPKGVKEMKSNGVKVHRVNTGKKDEDDDPIFEETGNITITLKTKTTYADGNPKDIKIFNAKGAEVSLGGRKIGNGSRGRLKGTAFIYKQPGAAGISLYLSAVQLTKFVEFSGGPSFDEVVDEDADDSFEGFDGEMAPVSDKGSDKPRL